MAKTLREAQLTTRNARDKLPAGTHWRSIDPDTHLGYRKGSRGGRWLVRWYSPAKVYKQITLTTADDVFPADGEMVLDFQQATRAARAAVIRLQSDFKAERHGPSPTVADAIKGYVAMRERRDHTLRREKGVHYDAISRLRKWVLTSEIAQIKLIDLQENQLRNWCLTLPAHLKPTTIARIATDLKAALNLAVQNHRQQLPVEITSTIRFGLKTNHLQSTEGRKPQILSDDEIRQIIAAARRIDALKGYDGDLARMVLLLAATGARFSQVTRLRTSDIQISKQRIMLPVSRKGRGTKARKEIAFLIGTDVLAEFTKIIEQSSGDEPLLQRWTHRKTKLGWERASRGPWTEAASLTRPFREIIKEAGLRPEIVPYALRHSSIVRHLRENLPVRHVAALHDTSVAMIEQHYSAYIVDALDELSARAIIPLTS